MLLPRHSMWNLPVWIYTGKQWLHSLQKSFCTQFRHFEYILVFSIILISLEPSAWNLPLGTTECISIVMNYDYTNAPNI